MIKSVTNESSSRLFNMYRTAKIALFLLFTTKLLAKDIKPPIVFTKAELVNAYTTRIPFKVIDQLIVVEASLLDQSGNFIIDTGSQMLILNSNYFKSNNRFREKTYERSGVNEKIEHAKQKFLNSFKLNAMTVDQLKADVIDLSHFEETKKMKLLGIIGHSVLSNFEVFIDLHLNQMTLTKTDKNGERLSDKVYAEKISDSFSFKMKRHTIILDAKIGGRPVKFGLDTGAEYNQLNKKLDSKILKYFYPTKNMKLTGASGKQIKVKSGKLYRVSLTENIYFGPMTTVLADLKYMNDAFGARLDGVLGFEFFKQKRTIINYKKKLLYFIDYPIPKY